MALSTAQRNQVYRAFMRQVDAEPCAFTKQVLRAAVDDADAWADANAASYNTALNATFRAAATPAQKAALLGLLCWARAGMPLPEGQ